MKKENENQTTGLVEVFSFNQSSTPIRVQVINDEPWFVAKDVCDVLELTNHRMAIKSLDEDEVNSTYLTDALNRQRITNVVNESGFDSPDGSFQIQEITKAIESLNNDLKIPFSMYLSGYKYNEIAEKLNLPLGTVKSRIFFARQDLQKKLKDYR